MPKSGTVAAAAGLDASAGAAVGAAAGAAPGWAPSTSALTIRPPGPLPLMPARSMPRSAAIRLASGEAITLPSSARPELVEGLLFSCGLGAWGEEEDGG